MSPDKTALVLRLLYGHPLCAACISDMLEVDPEDAIVDLLTRIQDGVYLKTNRDRCRACGRTTVVYSLSPGHRGPTPTARVGRSQAPGGTSVTLSRLAARALAFLETIPDRRACEDCTGTYLDVYRQQVLNTFRELVEGGRLIMDYARCDICRAQRLVARLRPDA
jgi:uncharacterized protein with PIN domain